MRRTIGRTITFSIDADVFRRFPALRVGALVVSRVDRAAASVTPGEMRAAWTATAKLLARGGITCDNVTSARAIQEWRRAFAACGVSPSTYTAGVEAVVRRALAEGHPADIVPIVELCRAMSARHLAPLTGYDLESLPSPTLTMRTARPGSDWFVPLGARPTDLPLDPSIVVYASGTTILSWSFNHRDSRQTCLRDATRHAVFFSEAIADSQTASVQAALEELQRVMTDRGAHANAPVFADRAAPELSLRLDGELFPGAPPPSNSSGETRP